AACILSFQYRIFLLSSADAAWRSSDACPHFRTASSLSANLGPTAARWIACSFRSDRPASAASQTPWSRGGSGLLCPSCQRLAAALTTSAVETEGGSMSLQPGAATIDGQDSTISDKIATDCDVSLSCAKDFAASKRFV